MFVEHLNDLSLDETGNMGDTYKTLGAGFWALKQKDYRKALHKLVMAVRNIMMTSVHRKTHYWTIVREDRIPFTEGQ